MKFNTEKLRAAVQIANVNVGTKAVIPAYQNMKIRAEGDVCYFEASNPEGWIQTSAGFEGDDGFEACVDARIFSGILKTLSTKEVNITLEEKDGGKSIVLKWGRRNRHSLPYAPPDEFVTPKMDPADDVPTVRSVGVGDLAPALSRAIQFAARNDLRASVNNISVSCQGDDMTLFGTDGNVFYMEKILARGKGLDQVMFTPIVPTMMAMSKAGVVQITEMKSNIEFVTPNMKLVMIKSDNPFPQILDKVNQFPTDSYIKCKGSDIKSIVQRLSTYRTDGGFARIECHIEEDSLLLKSHDFVTDAKSQEEVEIERVNLEPLKIIFNGKILNTAILSEEDGHVKICMKGPKQAVVIIGTNENIKTVAMPMAL